MKQERKKISDWKMNKEEENKKTKGKREKRKWK